MNLTRDGAGGANPSMRLLLALQEFWPVLYALPNFRTAHMDLLINTFGTRIRSSGERIVLALPSDNANYKMKKEYPIRALEKIIIDHHSAPFFYFDRRGTVSFGGRRRYRLLEFLRHARRPDFFEQPEGHGGIAQSPGCVFQLAKNPGALQDTRGRQGSYRLSNDGKRG